MQANPQVTEGAFEFLLERGFTLDERWISGGQSFRDGWRLSYSSPNVRVVVQYLDCQFEVHFVRADIDVSYLALDRDLFGRRSGFHGDMFPPEKLEQAVTRIADDIRRHYDQILLGDEEEWLGVARLQKEQPRTSRLP